MKITHSTSVTLHGITAEQFTAIQALLNGKTATDTDEDTDAVDMTELKKKAAKKTKPAKTVSEDEDEDFGEKEMMGEDLDEDADEDADEDEDEEEGLTFEEVKAAINKYGNKHPDQMKAILLGFNFKSTKELKEHKAKWEPVYRKVMAKLKKK